ncbi:hypothetical protein WA1_01525 [Scytonema hofmannii PCC 7110]|uniref:Type I-B CRISPR Cas8b N-terminal domain-containing protein n=1 Tax=Scytonema hofmannii PCC 7110 TaxID=128403 RepID=A0A139XGP2_9CYAN|nr:hypothetical protein [Scytonema hofmannii]KYC43860.1 hypothetical protein WA1_01525 [Scytonema hofmannii PCC 7110]
MKELELSYQLVALPCAQHRAGLAGLVLMVQELHHQSWFLERQGAMIELEDLNELGVTLRSNLEGLKALFDFTYKAFEEERSTDTKINNYTRIDTVEITGAKGKNKTV